MPGNLHVRFGGRLFWPLWGQGSRPNLLGLALLYTGSGLTSLDGVYIFFSMHTIKKLVHNYTTGSNDDEPPILGIGFLILSVGYLFKISAAPFHFWSPDVNDAIPTIVTTFVAIIAKISILIFLLELVYYTGRSKFGRFNWTYTFLISSILSLMVGAIVGLVQFRIKRLLSYSTIVRLCAPFSDWARGQRGPSTHALSDYASDNRLSTKGNPEYELSMSCKGGISSKQSERIASRVELPMIKATLPEVHLLVPSSIGGRLVCNRPTQMSISLKLWEILRTILTRVRISYLNIENERSKGRHKTLNVGTGGLPKARNGYGNRGFVVASWRDGIRVTVKGSMFHSCSFQNAAGSSSIVKSNAIEKLAKMRDISADKPDWTFDNIYKLMYAPELYAVAYEKLKSKPGNMTPGITPTTLDGFSTEVIGDIIKRLQADTFQFQPGRRVLIPKPSGGNRPLTVTSARDKIVQEVMRMILEAIFEPGFSQSSHGFRPGKSCHTALAEVKAKFGVATWYIEGDISKCFDSFDHEILMSIIGKRIKDERFLRLIRKTLKAGFLEFRVYKHSVTGTPQGSIISPILCNVYLDSLDKLVEKLTLEFDKGKAPKTDKAYTSAANKKKRAKTVEEKVKWHKVLQTLPSKDPLDPNFRRLVYVRYADDWIIGIRGTKVECKNILNTIKEFLLKELKLNLSETKTLITNPNNEAAIFLGTRLRKAQHTSYNRRHGFTQRNPREIRLEIPKERIEKKLREAGFLKGITPAPRFLWMPNTKDGIILLYNSVYHGIMNYYSFAHNFNYISSWLHFTLKSSCAKLLAAKLTLKTQRLVYGKFGKDLKGKDKTAFAKLEMGTKPWNFKKSASPLIHAMYSQALSKASLSNLSCSMCGDGYRVEMHHIRMLKDLNPKLDKIDELMAKNRRKQIPLCRTCHMDYHKRKSERSNKDREAKPTKIRRIVT